MEDPSLIVQSTTAVALQAEKPAANAEEFVACFDMSTVPTAPGCYIMEDGKGKPIYVGKAKSLRARIRSYINASDSRYSVKFLMRRVARIQFLVTANEKEALLLENSLIKQHRPRYNVQLKDDKTFISLRVDLRQEFPRITVVRRYRKDGARYFGPYHSASSVRHTLSQLQRLFPLRTCSDHVLKNRSRPCLYYQMKQCVAPCVDYVTRDAYHELLNQVVLILEGKSDVLEQQLLDEINACADTMDFEKAATVRDRLYDLRRTLERQRTVAVPGVEDRDIFGIYHEGSFVAIQILFYRGGKMLGGRNVFFKRQEMPLDELLSSFVLQYYSEAPAIPAEVLVPLAFESTDTLGEILTEQRGSKVHVNAPQRGEKLALIDLANKNAEQRFHEKNLSDAADKDALSAMKEALQLPVLPKRMECFDISTIQGTATVASMVVFTDGQPDKARYRRYSMKTVDGQDDFASMREVLLRRYTRAIEERDLPDFVLIDGGKGQLGMATAVFKDLGIEDLPHAGIAKARTQEVGDRSPERFFLPGRMNPIVLPQNGPVVQLATRIRNEAHRFAITYHRKKRAKVSMKNRLVEIPGVGPVRAKTLLTQLGSVSKVREASIADIAALPGFNQRIAHEVYTFLRQSDKTGTG